MAGTIFDRSRVSLQEWFAAAWYVTNQKHGVSALGLQRLLGLDLPFDSTAATPAVEVCSSYDYCKMLSSHRQRGTGHRDLSPRCKNTTGSGHCTKAATPFAGNFHRLEHTGTGSIPRGESLAGFPNREEGAPS